MITLEALEEIIDASGIAPRIEAVLPIGVRSRQLRVRTLLAGMCLTQADGRPAHFTRVHQALTSLPGEEQRRLGVITEWKHGPHLLTYRQAEYTFGLIAGALGKQEPDGLPSAELQAACDDLLEASIPDEHKTASAALAVDWTDMETFSRPPPKGTSDCADPEASWGHRKNNLLRCEDELFFGYYFSAGIMMPTSTARRSRSTRGASPSHHAGRTLSPRSSPSWPRCPSRESRSATSSPTPATPTASPRTGRSRCARPAPSSSRTCTHPTAGRTAPTTAPSSPTAACTAPRHPPSCSSSGRWPAAPPASRPRRTTPGPRSWAATSSAASPATTLTATTGSCAPLSWARSAARSAPSH